ncbi:Peptidyl-Prolyl Cis-Trans Isomerase E [Manis pentadactyla]|nr:Peptidyl-Prolyl Cis-Trans Isomerase E [Manis pentadactyla]
MVTFVVNVLSSSQPGLNGAQRSALCKEGPVKSPGVHGHQDWEQACWPQPHTPAFQCVPRTTGLLSMASFSLNTSGSQFFLTCDKTDWLDGKDVVFGEVTEGLDVLRQIEAEGSKDGKPKQKVIIADCGEYM